MHDSIPSFNQWQLSGQYLKINGFDVFTKVDGNPNAPVLLLIHGFPTASWDWYRLWHPLAQKFRLITFDLLGLGLSDKPLKHSYSVAEQADIATQILTYFSVNQFSILAHDLGDTVAQELLARANLSENQMVIEKLILLNGGLFPETHRPILAQKLLVSPFGKFISLLISFKSFKRSMLKICGTNKPTQTELMLMWQFIDYKRGRLVFPELLNYMKERKQNRSRWVGALQSTQTSIMVINGSKDPISGRHLVDRLRSLNIQAKIIELPDDGHYPHIENPTAVLSAVESFFV